MLTIYFHIGPLKTGTTSIQQYLRRTIGSEEPKRVWYPMTTGSSPGHVALFKDLAGRNETYEGLLELWIEQAKRSGVEKLILSQEDFCRCEDEVFRKLRHVCKDDNLHLIITHRSLRRRFASAWQEKIKHGQTYPLDELDELLTDRQFNYDLIHYIMDCLEPDETSVITSGIEEDGEQLIRRVIDCLDIEDYISESANEVNSEVKINRSHGRVETEFIRYLNLLSGYLDDQKIPHDYLFMRRMLVNMMQTPRWKEKSERLPIELTSTWEEKVTIMAQALFDSIYADFKQGKINVYGDLNHVLE